MSKLAFLLAVFCAGASAAQTSPAPGFAGQWRFNKDQSDTGGFAAPENLKKTITFQDPVLQVHASQTSAGKTRTQDLKYYTNGFETKNQINGANAYSTAHWEDSTLVIHTNLQDPEGRAVVIDERWSLTPDKSLLNTKTKITTLKGATTVNLVWQKGE